jgi:hypothetical protein
MDDLVIVPLGILAAAKLIPPPLLIELRARAETDLAARPVSNTAAAAFVTVWILILVAAGWWLYHLTQ